LKKARPPTSATISAISKPNKAAPAQFMAVTN
jgi:hypothetical protein